MRLAPKGLFYLYYSLDNRPGYYSTLLRTVTATRHLLLRVRSEKTRRRLARLLAIGVYRPMVGLGTLSRAAGIRAPVPLYESYRSKSLGRIEQDAYDRFFTSIEQRVSQDDIRQAFCEGFKIRFSDFEPFWHFLVEKSSANV